METIPFHQWGMDQLQLLWDWRVQFLFFAGGSPYDIMGKYGISHSEVMESVWYVVDAVNTVEEFTIEYPESAEKQEEIAQEFKRVSQANIDICAGAIVEY